MEIADRAEGIVRLALAEDLGVEGFERKQRERDIAALHRKAAKLGFTLIQPEALPEHTLQPHPS